MLELARILVDIVLPVFLIAAVGFVGRRVLAIDPQPIARLALYLLVPALLFQTLLNTQLAGAEIARIGTYVVLLTLVLVPLSMLSARWTGATRSQAAGFTLGVAFLNAANYGLPVNLFAFGQDGFDRAAVFVVFENILTYTVGVFVAAGGKLPWRRALATVFRMPVLWGALLALAIRVSGFELPVAVLRATTVLSGGAIPVILILLGMQLASITPRAIGPRAWAAVVGRLVVSPTIGLALTGLLGPSAVTRSVLVLESAMPSAVNATLIAAEFDAEPELVSTIALLTTAISMVTVTGWVAFLRTL